MPFLLYLFYVVNTSSLLLGVFSLVRLVVVNIEWATDKNGKAKVAGADEREKRFFSRIIPIQSFYRGLEETAGIDRTFYWFSLTCLIFATAVIIQTIYFFSIGKNVFLVLDFTNFVQWAFIIIPLAAARLFKGVIRKPTESKEERFWRAISKIFKFLTILFVVSIFNELREPINDTLKAGSSGEFLNYLPLRSVLTFLILIIFSSVIRAKSWTRFERVKVLREGREEEEEEKKQQQQTFQFQKALEEGREELDTVGIAPELLDNRLRNLLEAEKTPERVRKEAREILKHHEEVQKKKKERALKERKEKEEAEAKLIRHRAKLVKDSEEFVKDLEEKEKRERKKNE